MSKNSKLFKVGDAVSVDMETGEETPIEGGGMRMLPGPPGSCEWCHTEHERDQPHNRDSLPYQMKFNAIHGRWPTWTDAMSHCESDVRKMWRDGLVKIMEEKGIEVPDDLCDDQFKE
jgi:hypothetical protein